MDNGLSHVAIAGIDSFICSLRKNDSLNHFCLRLVARLIGVPITPALWGEEEPPHKVKAYLRDTPTAYGERRRDTVAFESLLACLDFVGWVGSIALVFCTLLLTKA